MRCRQCKPVPEEVARAADLLGRRWMLAVLWASAEEGAVRFNEFKQALEGIPPRTLAARLAELEAAILAPRSASTELTATPSGRGAHRPIGGTPAVRGCLETGRARDVM
jgi:DNA-binding HxlR family transcriptional regulator